MIQGRLRALRLLAFTSSVFPGEWDNEWTEMLVPDLLEFGFHARKVNELCTLKDEDFPSVDKMAFSISEGDPGNWERSYRNALNALMHMKTFIVGHVHADHRQTFAAATSNLMTLYFKVSTDKFPEVTISIFGLAECFLNYVIPKVRDKQPDLVFYAPAALTMSDRGDR